VKESSIQRQCDLLLQAFRLEWPTLFLLGSIGVFLFQIDFSIERRAATPGKNIQFEIETRIIQIGDRIHLGAPNHHVPNFIGGSEESTVR
jgi:hypothetical protein